MIPFSSRPLGLSFEARVEQWRLAETEAAYATGFVPNTVFFLVDGPGRILGALSYRPRLNERLRLNGGHLGYGIRPSERRRGIGQFVLNQAATTLPCPEGPAFLVTCDEDNLASRRTIEACGGVLIDQPVVEGVATRRYTVTVSR
jgi:predicted acetyltransferase